MRVTTGPEEPSDDTPSVTPFGRASSLREGAGNGGAVPFIRVLANIRGYGRFSSPLRNSKVFYIPPFNRVLAKPWGYGRFSSPLRKLRRFWTLQFIGMGACGMGADSSISDRNFGKMLKKIWSIDRKVVCMVEYSQKKRHFACEQIEKRIYVCQEIHRRISGQRPCGGSGF